MNTAIAIAQHVPVWVFGLLAALFLYGLSQARARTASLVRITALPLAMLGLSLYGVFSAFDHQPLALLAWAKGLAVAVFALSGRIDTSAMRYDAATRQFSLPGSWWPLVLMMGIFSVKFGVGVTLALHPDLRHSTVFAVGASAAYGLFSGVFLGRAMALWTLARQSRPLPQSA